MDAYQLWFRSPLFRVEPGEDKDTNPGCYGRGFAHWLGEQLRQDRVMVEAVVPEDWGWCVIVQRSPFRLWVGCGNVRPAEDTPPDAPAPSPADLVWTCMVVAEMPLLARLLRQSPPKGPIDELFERVQRIVGAAPGTVFVEEP